MKEKNYDELYAYIQKLIKSGDRNRIVAFKRYIDTYLIHVVDLSVYSSIRKMLKDHLTHETGDDSVSQKRR